MGCGEMTCGLGFVVVYSLDVWGLRVWGFGFHNKGAGIILFSRSRESR